MSKMYLKANHLYLSITNNKDNIHVLQYIGEKFVGKHTFPVFRDILDEKGEELYCMSALIAYTEKRFKTLSKLSYDEVMELFYQREFPYQYEFNKEGDKNKDQTYIDPIVNFEKYSSKAREIIISMGEEVDYYVEN